MPVILAPAPKLPPCQRALLPDRPEGMPYAWPVGVNRADQTVWQSLERTGHILLTEACDRRRQSTAEPGSCKPLRPTRAEETQALLIDPKAVGWPTMRACLDLPLPIATTADVAAVAWPGWERRLTGARRSWLAWQRTCRYNRKAQSSAACSWSLTRW